MNVKKLRKMKKLTSLLLVIVMLIGVLPANLAFAEESISTEPSELLTEVAPEETAEPEQTAELSQEPEQPMEVEDTTYANSISGMLWIDMKDDQGNGIYSGNGIYDVGERPLTAYKVSLYLESDKSTAVQTETTDAGGKYKFTNIEPGSYVVGVISETVGDMEYLLPLVGITSDNKFEIDTTDWVNAYTDPMEITEDTVMADINAGLRTPPGIQPLAANATANTYSTLQTAITNAGTTPGYVIEITAAINFGTNIALTIGANQDIIIQSDSSGPWILTQNTGSTLRKRHFTVEGNLTLQNIILEGGAVGSQTAQGGGVNVNSYGKLVMNNGAVIQNCYSAQGGGVNVASYGELVMNNGAVIQGCGSSQGGGVKGESYAKFTMYGGTVSGNKTSTASGGGVYMGIDSTFDMSDGKISSNTSNYGGGVYIWGQDASQDNATFNMSGGEISGNKSTYDGGGVYVWHSTLDISGTAEIKDNVASNNNGGGVYVSGSSSRLNMSGGKISNNKVNYPSDNIYRTASYGGGVHINTSTSQFTMSGGEISGNEATYGGGVYVLDSRTVTMSGDAKIINNIGTYGGGVCVDGSGGRFTMSGGTISNNEAISGGGVYVYCEMQYYDVTLTMSDGEISNNEAVNGGGVYLKGDASSTSGALTMSGGKISNNEADGSGGGVFMDGYSKVTMSSGEINANNAGTNGGGIYLDTSNATVSLSGSAKLSGNEADALGNGVYIGGTFNVQGNTSIDKADYVFIKTGYVINVTGSFTGATTINPISLTTSGAAVESVSVAGTKLVNYTTAAGGAAAALLAEQNQIFVHINVPTCDQDMFVGKSTNSTQLNYLTYVSANKVTFDPQGGIWQDLSTDVRIQTIKTGTTVTEPSNNPTRQGYIFAQWYTGTISSGTLAYADKWVFTTPVMTDLTLYAKWTPESYNITINYEDQSGNDITPAGALKSDTATYGSRYTAVVPSITGYVLADWQLDGSAQTTTNPAFTMPAANVVITLVYSQSGGSGSTGGGTEDILITKKFRRVDGMVLKPDQTVTLHKGDSFNDAHDNITGYDYTGYKIDSGAIQTGRPNLFVGSAIQAVITITGNTTVTYIYKAKQYNINVKAVDENGKSIDGGSYDWTASRGYKESFDTTAPTIKGYTYQYWKLNSTQKSGKIAIASVEANADILLVYQKQADGDTSTDDAVNNTTNNKKTNNTTESDEGNYQFIKKPNVKNVTPGETVAYTFTGFGNQWSVPLENFAISDRPDKGLDFVSARLPAFTRGSGVTYDIYYITNLNGRQTLQTGVSADSPHTFYAPNLASGEYITAITFEFGTVPAGFAVGDSITIIFRVWDNPPSKTLTNIGVLSYKVDGKNLEFVSGGAVGTILIDGYFGMPKTGDNSSVGIWFALMGASFGGILLMFAMPQICRRKRQKRC